MVVAKVKGKLRGKKPKLSPTQEKHPVELWRAGQHTSAELASKFGVGRSTAYLAVERGFYFMTIRVTVEGKNGNCVRADYDRACSLCWTWQCDASY